MESSTGLHLKTEDYKWLFLDLNSYFASVEVQERPELRGKPVVVVPMQTDYTVAIAANSVAKEYGIKTGTRIPEAKRVCPNLRCVLARHDVYVRYHHLVMAEVVKHVPIRKVCSIDEFSSRLPQRFRNAREAIAVAQRIKDGIRKHVGETITCSIGIAPNSFLAKVATDMQKPDGLVVLESKTLPERIFSLELTDLPGISRRMQKRLNQAGIHTVEHFWQLSGQKARRIWGSVLGEKMWLRLHGHDVEDSPTRKSAIGHSRILDPELRPLSAAWTMARKLTTKAAARLRREEHFASVFDLSVRTPEREGWQGAVKLPHGQDNFRFLAALEELWQAMLSDLRPHKLQQVSVMLLGLRRREDVPLNLFDTPSQAGHALQLRRQALSMTMDKINRHFGADTLRLGVVPKTQAGYVGTKISFTRIPDIAEFLE